MKTDCLLSLNKMLISDTEDERSIANQLERETKREKEPSPEPKEVTDSKKDSTLPVRDIIRRVHLLATY